jgi:hypothetical protein
MNRRQRDAEDSLERVSLRENGWIGLLQKGFGPFEEIRVYYSADRASRLSPTGIEGFGDDAGRPRKYLLSMRQWATTRI